MRDAMIMGAGDVPGAEIVFFVNGGPPGMLPRIFDELFWPTANQMIDIFANRGFKARCHWDNDRTPHLETVRDIVTGIPKVMMDLGRQT